MEPVSKRSKIGPSEDTFAVEVAPTQVTFSGHLPKKIHPITAPSSGIRQFVFQILPDTSNVLHLPSSKLVTTYKLLKENGDDVEATAQVGILQGWGATSWATSVVRINGSILLPEFTLSDNACFMKCQFQHTKRQRSTSLYGIG